MSTAWPVPTASAWVRFARHKTPPVCASTTESARKFGFTHVVVSQESFAPRGVEKSTSFAVSVRCAASLRGAADRRAASIASVEPSRGSDDRTRSPCTGEPVTLMRRPSLVTFAFSPLRKAVTPPARWVHEM